MLVNVGHTAIAKVLLMAVQFAVATLLARNLSAEDYGVVGFANVLMGLLLRIKGMGLVQAVVRTPQLEKRTLNAAATLNILFSVLAFICAQAMAPLAGRLLDSPASVSVVRVLSFGFLLAPLGFLPTCLLTREMKFGRLRFPAVTAAVVRGLVAVSLAITGWKYWSLVIGDLIGTLTNNGLLQLLRSARFKWKMDWEQFRLLVGFGMPLTLASLVTFIALNADSFAIGAVLGSRELGLYTVAFTWATFVCTTFQEVLHSVLFPKFSKIQSDLIRMRQAFLKTLLMIGCGSALINGVIFVTADGFLYQILGKGTDRWLPATTSLRILCIYGIVRALVETVGNPIMALGETRLLLKATSLAALLEGGLIYFIANIHGIKGISVLVTLAYSSQCIIYVPFVRRQLGVKWSDFLKVTLPPVGALAVGAGIVFSFTKMVSLEWQTIFFSVGLYVVTFLIIHECLSKGKVLSQIKDIWKALVRRELPNGI